MNIGIIGGGITGLTAAYKLSRKGYTVVLFEGESSLGGSARTFSTNKYPLECFYHHIFSADHAIISLIKDLGLSDNLITVAPRTGLYYQDNLYPFTSPLDILRFSSLDIFSRARLGLVSAYLKYLSPWETLQDIGALEWCRQYFGQSVTKIVWEPLLSSKFGKYADQIIMSWLWARLKKRTFNLVYIKGSLKVLFDKLEERIRRQGGQVRLGTRVERVTRENRYLKVHGDFGEECFDRIISTIAPPILAKIVDFEDNEYQWRLTGVKYLSASTLVVKTKEMLTDYYWININDTSFPFLAMVEQGNLISPAYYGGYNYLYFGNYWPSDDLRFSWSAQETFKKYLPYIRKIRPDLKESLVEDVYKFDAPYAQPVVDRGYKDRLPGLITPWTGLAAGSIANIYPWDRGINYSVTLADDLINALGVL